ncbi:MAG: hypothetical protein M1835_000717 [Candelina submexicana]|nr:MAG: hypothetical protein M1835_000717 [Candelina submexicana]
MHFFTIQNILYIIAPFLSVALAMATNGSSVNGVNSLANLKQTVDTANEQVATATIKSGVKQLFTTGTVFGMHQSIAGQVNNVSSEVNKALENLRLRPADFKNFDPALNNIEVTYLAYVDDVPNFAQTVGTKGTTFHVELNQPVADALTNLNRAVQALGTALSEKGFISEVSVSATEYAGDTLMKARSAWMGLLNFKGSLETGSVLF